MSHRLATDTQVRNAWGEWVPAIPLPLFVRFGRKRCRCRRTFWTTDGYRGHYAYAHVLGMVNEVTS